MPLILGPPTYYKATIPAENRGHPRKIDAHLRESPLTWAKSRSSFQHVSECD